MHIPDGFLDVKTAAATAVLASAGFAVALHQAKSRMPRRKIPLMGVAAAFVFAAQMLSFPVAAGTSGHLVGSVLTAVLLGPGPAVMAMTSVLIVQSLLFADGGLLALGANVFNMAIVGSVGGYAIYRLVLRFLKGDQGRLLAAGFASWCSTVIAAICVAGELAWSGTAPWNAAFPAMATVHMLIGLGEACITVLVLAAIARTRPEILQMNAVSNGKGAFALYGLILALGLALLVSPFASQWPDGLEKAAAAIGFEQKAVNIPRFSSPMGDYEFPGIGSPEVATAIAGGIGTLVAFGVSFLLARLFSAGSRAKPSGES